ncbi:peptidoglycan-binding protein [Streptomyces sp. NBC_00872]|uniref:peptidoglycan-binding protein n=1 Tax=Streptomyces sp. NBC_00872 TaxID=2903686 RepID=UPI003869C205|nr:peptidoglycan-binding protein [Streptomyces sp. NBC_00872]
MTVPVFEEYEPARDCPCAGCAERRRDLARGLPVRAGGHPAAHGARRALLLATATGVALGTTGTGVGMGTATAWAAGQPAGTARHTAVDAAAVVDAVDATAVVDRAAARSAAADARVAAGSIPSTPQGGSAPLHGRPLPGPGAHRHPMALRGSTRADIINRAKRWSSARVPYSLEKFWSDGYRQDCSGFVSMAWNLAGNEWTGTLARYGVRIDREDLQPGDMLLFHNPASPIKGSHVTIFGGWTDYTHSSYLAYEQAQPHARAQPTPMAYWSHSGRYVPYRYRGLAGSADAKGPGAGTGTGASALYPGTGAFGPGANNAYVGQLGRMLVQRGGGRFYARGPGPRWGDADRRATQAFQRAQGWRGAEADGRPGAGTWRYLVRGLGKDIPAAGAGESGGRPGGGAGGGGRPGGAGGGGGTPGRAPAYPGAQHFRPGGSGTYVELLGRQLVRKGFGRYYTSGPGRVWTEADRRNVEAFQRAQGWRGAQADGYPGPGTWQRLFA